MIIIIIIHGSELNVCTDGAGVNGSWSCAGREVNDAFAFAFAFALGPRWGGCC